MPGLPDIKADIVITLAVILTEDDQATLGGARLISITKKLKFSDLDTNDKKELRLLRKAWNYRLKTYYRQSEAYKGLGAII